MGSSLMYQTVAALILALMIAHATVADPDPLNDFCVGKLHKSKNTIEWVEKDHRIFNGMPCKEPSEVSVDDFVYEGIREAGNVSDSSTGFAGTSATVMQFPGLNTLGMSAVRADFENGGLNVPHLHPRATEIGYVVEGSLYCGFITSENKLYAKVIHKGDLMVFPRGLVHFQMNVGHGPAVLVGTFNSENPGTLKLPFTLFGSGIEDHLLQKAFHLSKKEVRSLKAKFGPKE